MNETTDLEQIAALEHRITSALDRIARGVAARAASPVAVEQGEDQSEMEERLAALSAALEETQAVLQSEQSANADLSERLRAVEAARQADADQAGRDLAALQEQLAASPEPEEDDGPSREELQSELTRQREVESVLRRRIARLREERKAARAEYNETRERLEEVEGKLDQLQALTDAGAPAASGELARLRESNRALRETIDELREVMAGDGPPDEDLVTSALAAELESLKADRAAEAAEARAILSEIRPVLQGGAADA